MELFSLVLQIHIIGAATLTLLLTATVFTLYRAALESKPYKILAIALAITTLAEIMTGSAMFILASESNVAVFCAKMGIYLGITAIAEYALLTRLRTFSTTESKSQI